MIGKIWGGMIAASLMFGMLSGRMKEVSGTIAESCSSAVTLILSFAGVVLFWSGMMEVMLESGLAEKISRGLSHVTRRLFGRAAKDKKASEYISANLTANLL